MEERGKTKKEEAGASEGKEGGEEVSARTTMVREEGRAESRYTGVERSKKRLWEVGRRERTKWKPTKEEEKAVNTPRNKAASSESRIRRFLILLRTFEKSRKSGGALSNARKGQQSRGKGEKTSQQRTLIVHAVS